MSSGIIKAVDFKKGLGYVTEDTGREIVLVALGLEDAVAPGKAVRFDVKQTRRGIIAVNIRPAAFLS